MSLRSSSKTAPPEDSAPLFAALGDETRLGLVWSLSGSGPMSIARLTAGSGVSRQAVTKHLRIMEHAGLVCCSRHGRESIWQLDSQRLNEAQHYLSTISAQWDSALERLRSFVED